MKEGDDAFVTLSCTTHPALQTYVKANRQDVTDHRMLAAVDRYRPLPRPPVASIPAMQHTNTQEVDAFPHRRAASKPALSRFQKRHKANAAESTTMPGCAIQRSRCGKLYTLGLYRQADDFSACIADISIANVDQHHSLQVIYGVDDERRLVEDELHHLFDYDHTRPMGIGNGFYDQVQQDIHGSILDSL